MDILINLLVEEERRRKELETEAERPQLQLELPVYDPYMHRPEIEGEPSYGEIVVGVEPEKENRGVIIIEM